MSLIDRTRQSEVNSYFKLEEEYGSLVDHARELDEKLKQKEAELADTREFEIELLRKLILNKEGSLSNKEVVLSLFSYYEEQLKEKGE